jgi:hypothetical protein
LAVFGNYGDAATGEATNPRLLSQFASLRNREIRRIFTDWECNRAFDRRDNSPQRSQ